MPVLFVGHGSRLRYWDNDFPRLGRWDEAAGSAILACPPWYAPGRACADAAHPGDFECTAFAALSAGEAPGRPELAAGSALCPPLALGLDRGSVNAFANVPRRGFPVTSQRRLPRGRRKGH